MDWLNAGITALIIVVTVALAWGKFNTAIALLRLNFKSLDDRMKNMENNHLAHLQNAIDKVVDQMDHMKEGFIRMEEFIKNLKK